MDRNPIGMNLGSYEVAYLTRAKMFLPGPPRYVEPWLFDNFNGFASFFM